MGDNHLPNLTSRQLLEKWREGSQEAARLLMARYEVRLVALIASRLNRRVKDRIDAQDVVQSALGSFFRVTRQNAKSAIQLNSTASAWNILATFARRKLSHAFERESASKRGGTWDRVPLDNVDVEEFVKHPPTGAEADSLFNELSELLSPDQTELLELLLENATQREIAQQLHIDERTVRRKITALRVIASGHLAIDDEPASVPSLEWEGSLALPNITYRQFVLGKMIGTGGLGKVYRASLQQDGRLIAVKFLHRHLWADPTSKASFLREIDHAASLSHPGIVKYLGWGSSPHGGPYIISDFLDATSLAKAPRDSSDQAVQWLLQICQAIDVAHQAGVVHGDLTPNNVLITRDGRCVITDFGFASRIEESSETSSYQTVLGGTLGYAPPEQMASVFGKIGPAADIYAIGGLAYFLLTGKAPHYSKSDALGDTLSEDDVLLPDASRSQDPAKAKLLEVACIALRKAVSQRPKAVRELTMLLTNCKS
ncbi:MAG: protein kinase domain-containing protein [Planctomycetaceae bacterium]